VDFEELLLEECSRVSAKYTAVWCVSWLGQSQASARGTARPHVETRALTHSHARVAIN
jgi:hypothetical protein